MAAVEDRKLFSGLQEKSEQTGSLPAVDLSFIHWGYLNSTLVTDQSKKTKDLIWKTYWVDLCGSTLRLYRDLSLSSESGNFPPPAKVVGPTGEDEKKEAFLVLKKGASIAIPNHEEYQSRKKSKKALDFTRNNVFKLKVINSNNSPVYFFEAPSKGSMYRWISKLEEGIDIADHPENQSVSDKKLKEAKLLAMESRRYQNVAPELKYSDTKDDTDSGMEGDVEESIEFHEKSQPDPRLEKLLQQLHHKEECLEMLEKGERAFLGETGKLSKIHELKATTKADYYLVPGYLSTFIPKGTQINVLGQLPNRRWRCYVDRTLNATNGHNECSSMINSLVECSEHAPLLGSVPTSLLYELDGKETELSKRPDLTILPMGTPDVTPNVSPFPSPPQSPYSPHKPLDTSQEDSPSFLRRSPTNLQRFVPSMDLSDVDAWEQFVIPSPPSTPVTSRSTTPSLSPSESLETLDAIEDEELDDNSSNDIPVTYIGSAPDSKPLMVVLRNTEPETVSQPDEPKNYSFLVTKKLRQRGISLVVGSSSSEDEDDIEELNTGKYKTKISKRKLDKEFERFAANDQPAVVRPYSAFVPRKTTTVNFGTRPKNINLRTATSDDLLKDYSSSHSNIPRSKTCITLDGLQGRASTPENAPPINQRRTIQLSRSEKEGFGFTLQTYGIVQQNGEVEYMTFVLGVEDDGPAYMSGMRPGDIIISIENQDVEDADHKTLVGLLQNSPSTVRMVVVFVDAIRRMHLNTKLKVLSTELNNKEGEFKQLCKKEREMLTRSGDADVLADLDLDVVCPQRSGSDSYLYTTELTSSFSKDTRKVKDSIVKYQQQIDDKPRRTSLPDQSELTKQRLISTTGTQLLKSFASSAESILKKSASIKLKKKVQKTKQVSKTFKSYLEFDEEGESPIQTSSPRHQGTTKEDTEAARLSWPRSSKSDFSSNDGDTSTSGNTSPACVARVSNNEDAMVINPDKCSRMSNADSISSPIDTHVFDDPEVFMDENNTNCDESKNNQSSPKELPCVPTSSVDECSPQSSSAMAESSGDKDVNTNCGESDSQQIKKNESESKNNQSSSRELSCVPTSPVDECSPQSSSSMGESSGDMDVNTNCGESDSQQSKKNEAKQKLSEILKITRTTDYKAASNDNCDQNKKKNDIENENSISPQNNPVSTKGVDRSRTNNIASLRKLFEASSNSDKSTEQSDVFPSSYRKMPQKRPDFSRARLGSRPMSYMRAMDAAEDSPIIPDDNDCETQKATSPFESSA